MDTLPLSIGQVKIETLGALRVARYSIPSKEPETEGRNFLLNWLARQQIAGPIRHFGYDIKVTQEQKEAGLRGYEVWSTVPEHVQPSEGVVITDFPGGLYATVLLENPFDAPYETIPAFWKALHEWVLASATYQGDQHQCLEEYIPHLNGDQLKLYYPVKAA